MGRLGSDPDLNGVWPRVSPVPVFAGVRGPDPAVRFVSRRADQLTTKLVPALTVDPLRVARLVTM